MDSSSRQALHDLLLKDATFASLTTNADRVVHVLTTAMPYEQICTQVKANLVKASLADAKCSVKADCFFEESKLYISGNDLTQALVALRKALLFTPFKDQKLKAEIFASMTQVHYDMDNYEGALWAVDQAIEQVIKEEPESSEKASKEIIIEQMILRVNCLQKLHRQEEVIEAVEHLVKLIGVACGISEEKINQGQMEKFLDEIKQEYAPSLLQQDITLKAVDDNRRGMSTSFLNLDHFCITIRDSAQFGRHFIATTSIPSQTTILQERPFSVAMQPGATGIKCTFCQHDLVYRFYPCDHCIQAVYCDRKCASQDWAQAHWASCRGMKTLVLQLGSFLLHVFQMVTRVGGPKKALELQSNLEGYSIEQYLEDRSSNLSREEQAIADYKMSAILACHDEQHDLETDVIQLVMAIETAVALQIAHGNTDQELDMNFFSAFTSMLISNQRRLVYNVFGWTEWSTDLYVANCQCLVGSLINHSCVPNVKWDWKDGIINFTTKRAIEAGEEITISYGPNTSQTYVSRQQRLNHYLFACSCSACYTSATSGNSLKCRSCSAGPVVYDSALNSEPLLNGKCLCCHAPYVSFSRSIRELTRTKAAIKLICSMSQVSGDFKNGQTLLVEALKSLASIHKLALPENESALKATFMAIKVLERCEDQLGELVLEERFHVAELLDQCLPVKLPERLIKGQVMQSLAFWFKTTIKWGEELSLIQNLNPSFESTFEPRDALHLVQQFHYRYKEALKCTLESFKSDYILKEAIKKQIELLDEKMAKYWEKTF